MARFSLVGWFQSVVWHSRRSPRKRRPARRVLSFDALEDRMVLSTLTVTSAADDGSAGTLRAVLAAASPGDTVVFDRSLGGKTIALKLGQLSVTRSLDIEGPGAGRLTVSGSAASRVFDVGNGATVTIAGLTVANGAVTGDESDSLHLGGGGILNEAGATLTLSHVTVSNNTATAATDTVDVFGGGLLNEGHATVVSCTFSGNQALGGGGTSFFGGSVGGSIDNYGGATLTATGSTFTGNKQGNRIKVSPEYQTSRISSR